MRYQSILLVVTFSSCLSAVAAGQPTQMTRGPRRKLEITGQGKGGTATLGVLLGSSDSFLTIATANGDSPAVVAAKFVTAFNNKGDTFSPFGIFRADGAVIKTAASSLFFRTTDTGLGSVGSITNFRARTIKSQSKVIVSWTLNAPVPGDLLLIRNTRALKTLDGTATSFIDTTILNAESKALDTRYTIVGCKIVNAANGTVMFSDKSEVITQHPTAMADDTYKVLTVELDDAVKDKPYQATLEKNGGTNPVTWSVSAGTLPDGLTLNGDGLITGSPSAAGESTFTVQVTDSDSQTASKQLTLVVTALSVLTDVINE